MMPIGFVPIDNAAAVVGVNLVVDRPRTLLRYGIAAAFDSRKDRLEVVLPDSKTIVNHGKRSDHHQNPRSIHR